MLLNKWKIFSDDKCSRHTRFKHKWIVFRKSLLTIIILYLISFNQQSIHNHGTRLMVIFGYITNWRRAWSPFGSHVSPSAAPFHCSLRRLHGKPGRGAVTSPLASSGHWRACHLTPLMNVTHWMVFNVWRAGTVLAKSLKQTPILTKHCKYLATPRSANTPTRTKMDALTTAQCALTNRRESGATMATENKALQLVHFSRPCREQGLWRIQHQAQDATLLWSH